jgi:16S rRNA (cytosine967-C5)-methyltransferase
MTLKPRPTSTSRRRFSKKPSRKASTPKVPASQRPDRPLREDLVLQACLEAYTSVRHDGRLSDRALEFTLRHKKHLYSNERRAVAERVYSLLRRQLTVDWLLGRMQPGFDKLPTSQQDALRIATSRMLDKEDKDYVARTTGLGPEDRPVLAGFAEAQRKLAALPFKDRFGIEASLPPFLAEKFLREYGDQASAAAAAINARAPLTARVNGLKGTREALVDKLVAEGVTCRLTELSPLGVFLETRINAFSLKTFKEGDFELQDEGSQLLGMLVDGPPTRVVDACAGAGGKTLQIAVQMKNRGELFALDVDEGRLEEMRRRSRRAGVHNVRTRLVPAEDGPAREAVADLNGKVDRVLVDAPCSGSGTYRRKPDARYRLTPDALAQYAERQRSLLARFAPLVKPGGQLIYGTCSVLREENEDVVAAFLAAHPAFSVMPITARLGELGEKLGRDGFLRLAPHLHGTDGFFGAILARAR